MSLTPHRVALPGKVQLEQNSAAYTLGESVLNVLSSAGHAKLRANQMTDEQNAQDEKGRRG